MDLNPTQQMEREIIKEQLKNSKQFSSSITWPHKQEETAQFVQGINKHFLNMYWLEDDQQFQIVKGNQKVLPSHEANTFIALQERQRARYVLNTYGDANVPAQVAANGNNLMTLIRTWAAQIPARPNNANRRRANAIQNNMVTDPLTKPKHYVTLTRFLAWVKERNPIRVDRDKILRSIGLIYPANVRPTEVLQFIKRQRDEANEQIRLHNEALPDGTHEIQLDDVSGRELMRIVDFIIHRGNNKMENDNKTRVNELIARKFEKLGCRNFADYENACVEVEAFAISPLAQRGRNPTQWQNLPNYKQYQSLFMSRDDAFKATRQQRSKDLLAAGIQMNRKRALDDKEEKRQSKKRNKDEKRGWGKGKERNNHPGKSCRYDDKCTDSNCKRSHPSMNRDKGPKGKKCRFGDKCNDANCKKWHPSRKGRCKFGDRCWDANCKSSHSSQRRLCNHGANCNYLRQNGRCSFIHSPKELKAAQAKTKPNPFPRFNARHPSNRTAEKELAKHQQARNVKLLALHEAAGKALKAKVALDNIDDEHESSQRPQPDF